MIDQALTLGYVGPDTLLPAMTALSAVFGVLLIGWSYVVSFFRKITSFFVKPKD